MNFKSQKERAGAVRDFLFSNRLFLVIVLIAAVWVGGCLLNGEKPESVPETEQTEEVTTPTWRFYPSDLVVLGVGGGFCGVMIARERRKAKEGMD